MNALPVPGAPGGGAPPEGRVALQSVAIARVDALLARFGDRFFARFFTSEERAFCERRRHRAQHAAARLAAKLATRRVLGGGRLRDVEIVRDEAGAPSVRLLGGTAARGEGRRLLVSLSHDGGVALALVVGEW